MSTLAQKQLAFLEETANHYNLNNRCKKGIACTYHPRTVDLVGISEGCAIGRHLTPGLAQELDIDGGSVNDNDIFEVLPSELKELTQSFLRKIQTLHDADVNWDETGLSEFGANSVRAIKRQFKL